MITNKMQCTTGPQRPECGVNPNEPYISTNLLYERYKCQGFLMKEPERPKFWQKTWSIQNINIFKRPDSRDRSEENDTEVSQKYKRYFVLNHKT